MPQLLDHDLLHVHSIVQINFGTYSINDEMFAAYGDTHVERTHEQLMGRRPEIRPIARWQSPDPHEQQPEPSV